VEDNVSIINASNQQLSSFIKKSILAKSTFETSFAKRRIYGCELNSSFFISSKY